MAAISAPKPHEGWAAYGRWPRRPHARIRSCEGMRGGGFRSCPKRHMAERPRVTAARRQRPRTSAVAPGPTLIERLRRPAHWWDGGRLVGIVAPALARVGYPCAWHWEGRSRGRPRESTSQLGGRDEALPREAPEGSSMFGSLTCELPSQPGGDERRVRMARPILAPLFGPLGGQHWQSAEKSECTGSKGMKAA